MEHVFIGIDPGLVHTGAVAFIFDDERHRYRMEYALFDGQYDEKGGPTGPDLKEMNDWLRKWARHTPPVFIEAYRPRSHYQTDARMGRIVNDMRRAFKGSTTLDNTGVKKVVLPDLMKALGVWAFKTPSHHQDLRSAARIGLFGALKDEALNRVVYDYITSHLDGGSWTHEGGS